MSQRIAFFDFDGTITTKDTLLEFAKYCKGSVRFYLGFFLTSPWMIAYKLKIISNQKAKERFLRYFFHNCPIPEFERQCISFANDLIPALIRPKALREISQLQEKGIPVVIVSASPENWIRPWSDKIGAELLATRLEIRDNLITGKILGRNCHGNEKINRIKDRFDLAEFEEVYAYGDTSGDKPMLSLAHISFYKPFR